MSITKMMILERGLQHIEKELDAERKAAEKLDRIRGINEVISARNYKMMYIAQLEQIRRQIREQIDETKAEGA